MRGGYRGKVNYHLT